jgi:hypothetical protein
MRFRRADAWMMAGAVFAAWLIATLTMMLATLR